MFEKARGKGKFRSMDKLTLATKPLGQAVFSPGLISLYYSEFASNKNQMFLLSRAPP